MSYAWLKVGLLSLLMATVAGCSKPESPQEVAAEFWQAMEDYGRALAEAGARLSQLSDESFSSYQRKWSDQLDEISGRTKRFLEDVKDSTR
ncbi:MAG: hypothetical protein R6U69_06140 [Marinobacter sp.]|uniref:hypothetical protein n=1 Tax=Marinobacter sp. TaxID=50741 RepID=UPI0035694C75